MAVQKPLQTYWTEDESSIAIYVLKTGYNKHYVLFRTTTEYFFDIVTKEIVMTIK